MKYIMIETPGGLKLPIIFPDVLTHAFVAGAMQLAVDTLRASHDLRPRQCEDLLKRGDNKPISAGFVTLSKVHVSGRSETLNLDSKPIDAERIRLSGTVEAMPDAVVARTAQAMDRLKGDKSW